MRGITLAITLVGFGLANPVAAQPEEPTSGEATPDAETLERARAHFEAALEAYEEGSYEAALGGFREAYALTENPEFLYNIAQCADRLRYDDVALDAYRRYLQARPEAEGRAGVEARIAVIERNLAEEGERVQREVEERERRRREEEALRAQIQRERAAAEEARRNRPDPPPDPGALPWVVVGAGAAVAAAGVAFLVVGELDAACVGEPSDCVQDPSMPRWSEVVDAYDRAQALRIAGGLSVGVGAAAIIAGLTWGLVAQSARDSYFAVTVGPGSLGLRGRFE